MLFYSFNHTLPQHVLEICCWKQILDTSLLEFPKDNVSQFYKFTRHRSILGFTFLCSLQLLIYRSYAKADLCFKTTFQWLLHLLWGISRRYAIDFHYLYLKQGYKWLACSSCMHSDAPFWIRPGFVRGDQLSKGTYSK